MISRFLFASFCASLWPLLASAAEPTVADVSPRGVQVGATTTVIVSGNELGTDPKLLLPFAAKTTRKPNSTNTQATFDVSLDDAIPPGYHHLRIVTEGGVSLPVIIGVDRLPQKAFPLATESPTLPAALSGTIGGSTVLETTFAGKAGQKVMIEAEANRLGSKLRPVIHLYGPKKLQVAWSWPTTALHGDTRLEAALPDDGPYTVAIHDAEYAPPGPGFFRLKLGQWAFVDQVFPPVVGKDVKSVELVGPASPLPMRADVPATGGPMVALAWPKDGTWSGARPMVELSTRPELLEQPAAGKPQELPGVPVGVSGRLSAPNEEDRYRLPTVPGTKLRLEVFADRLGSSLDAAIVIRNEAGGDLARGEDSPNSLDPVLDFTVPDKVTAIIVAVLDTAGRGRPRGVYRLTVDTLDGAEKGLGDFRLSTSTPRVAVPTGSVDVVPVTVERRGYAGKIELSAVQLPSGLTLEGTTIPPGADGALVTVRPGAATGAAAVTTWTGRADNGRQVPVTIAGHPLERIQPWLATELAVAPVTVKGVGELKVEWGKLPADARIVPPAKLSLPVKVTRPTTDLTAVPPLPNAKPTPPKPLPDLPVRLTLLTSQPVPLTNRQRDLNRVMRVERPIELTGKIVDGEVVVLIPPDLPADMYDVTVQADLLAPNRVTVLATAFAPVKRLAVKLPVGLKLDAAKLDVKPDAKTKALTVDVTGEVLRTEGFAGDVTVTPTLPPGVAAAAVIVKGGTTKFTVKVTLPAATPLGELKGFQLSASAATDPKQPGVRVKSRELDVALNVLK